MGKISKMPPRLANMIAAGEVVERPSSVVKELVENAIDAKASQIQVILKNGGLDEIQIVDNGEGMDSSDVEMAFIPHATSKIKTEYDLSRIMSLGFRGEAIASIAAVSKMQIISSQDGISGYEVTYQAGSKVSSGITSANKGTVVTVKHLFYNTPARLKYLKPAKNELAVISYLLDRIALAHPDIRISLINDNKTYLSTSGSSNSVSLIGEIYGLEVAKNIIEKSYLKDGIECRLLLVKPEVYRSNKLEITFIVNGRYVKNYALTTAVIEGYKTFLPIGKYPIAVIYYTIDPTLIDVNVHPSKTEIKISNEEGLGKQLQVQIDELLSETRLIPTRRLSQEGYTKTSIFDLPRVKLEEEPKPYPSYQEVAIPPAESKQEEVVIPTIEPKQEDIVEPPRVEKPIPAVQEKEEKLPHLEYVGQIFGTYLIFQAEDGLYLVDQHAAAERINYEKYYELLGNEHQPTSELLVPIMLSFTKSEALFLEEHLADFSKLGFVIEQMSMTDYVVRQVPLWAKLDEAQDVIRDVFALLLEARTVNVITFRDAIAKQISCKASIKANHALSRIEIDELLTRLNGCKHPFTCPHGRPCIIRFSVSDIEKMFERIQS